MNDTIKKVLNKLEEKGYKAYLVGGYCRDYLIGKINTDYDICTNAKPKEIKQIFNKYTVPSDNYGCVTLFIDQKRFEITTFRKDIFYLKNRRPFRIKYVNDLETDLKRRDFKMNTICMDVNGNIIDFLNGKADIENKIISVVGDTNKKLKEDSLRMLRAVRFATTLNFDLDNNLKEGIINNAHLVKNLSYDRRKSELERIFSSPNCSRGLKLIKELGLCDYLEINLDNVVPTSNVIGIWAQINSLKYKFSNNEKEHINKIRELLNLNILDKKVIYKYGLYLTLVASEIKRIDKKEIYDIYNSLVIHDKKDIELTPIDICNLLKRKPGQFLKEIIVDIEDKIITNKLNNNKEELGEYIIKKYK